MREVIVPTNSYCCLSHILLAAVAVAAVAAESVNVVLRPGLQTKHEIFPAPAVPFLLDRSPRRVS